MKSSVKWLLIAFVLAFYANCHAQEGKIYLGVEAGINKSIAVGAAPSSLLFNGMTSFHTDVIFERRLSHNFCFGVGLGYIRKGLKYGDLLSDSARRYDVVRSASISIDYFTLHPSLKMFLNKHLVIGGGPYLCYSFHNRFKYSIIVYPHDSIFRQEVSRYETSWKNANTVNRLDYGLYFYLGYQYKNFMLKYQLERGLTPVFNWNDYNYNECHSISLVYYFIPKVVKSKIK